MTVEHDHLCVGPDGGQLLGFLCSLGLLEATCRTFPEREPRLGFAWHRLGWRPLLWIEPPIGFDELVVAVADWINQQTHSPELALGDDLPCDADTFEQLARVAVESGDRAVADRLAAFGWRSGGTTFDDTAFRTMRGAGHQHFLAFARELASTTTIAHLERCLRSPWDYGDPRPSLRFDPLDDRRYALRADDPASASSKQPIRTMRAANALAVEALRMLPVVPRGDRGETTLFDSGQRPPLVRWPIWRAPVTRDAATAIVSASLPRRGVCAVYECRRLTVGKVRVFTPARQVA